MEDRIRLLLEKEQLSSAEFADRIGIQRPTVSHVLSGRNKPGYTFLQRILTSFPSISARWLLLGEGEMYTNRPKQSPPADLFATHHNVNDSSDAVPYKSKLTTTTAQQKSYLPTSEKQPETERKEVKQRVEIEKIVVFYSDKTFGEYFPR